MTELNKGSRPMREPASQDSPAQNAEFLAPTSRDQNKSKGVPIGVVIPFPTHSATIIPFPSPPVVPEIPLAPPSPQQTKPLNRKEQKLIERYQGIERDLTQLFSELPPNTAYTTAQLAIKLRHRSDYVVDILNKLLEEGAVHENGGRWQQSACDETTSQSHLPRVAPSPRPQLVFGQVPTVYEMSPPSIPQQVKMPVPEEDNLSGFAQLPLGKRPNEKRRIASILGPIIEKLPPGSKMPTVLELAEQFGCSPTIAGNALQILQEEGRVVLPSREQGYHTRSENEDRKRPLTNRIADILRLAIIDMPEGSFIYTAKDIEDYFHCSRSTGKRVLRKLRKEGLITCERNDIGFVRTSHQQKHTDESEATEIVSRAELDRENKLLRFAKAESVRLGREVSTSAIVHSMMKMYAEGQLNPELEQHIVDYLKKLR